MTALHLAVANGFPFGTYRALIEALAPLYDIHHFPPRPLQQLPSDPATLVSWEPFADDLLRDLDAHHLDQVIAVGHSFGGVFSLMAAAKQPQRFSGLILLDSTFLDPQILEGFAAMRATGEGERFFLVKQALNRRAHFETLQSAFNYWRPKPLFADWTDAALWDYVHAGLVADGQGYRLIWSPEWEARIFETIPADEWAWLARVPRELPVLLVRGTRSDTLMPDAAAHVREALRADYAEIEGGHLFPLSAPDVTAGVIQGWVERLEAGDMPGVQTPG